MTELPLPVYIESVSTTVKRPASEKQVAFLKTLVAERPTAAGDLKPETLSLSEASTWISYLKTFPREKMVGAKAPSHAKVTESGFYFDPATKTVFRVRPTKDGGGIYAERLVPATDDDKKGTFVYERGLVFKVDPAWLLSREEACEIGRRMGFCVRCGALLTVEKSIARGLGPSCFKKWGASVKADAA